MSRLITRTLTMPNTPYNRRAVLLSSAFPKMKALPIKRTRLWSLQRIRFSKRNELEGRVSRYSATLWSARGHGSTLLSIETSDALGSTAVGWRFRCGGAVNAIAVRSRSPPCRRCGCCTGSRRADRATPERRSPRPRTARPSRQSIA